MLTVAELIRYRMQHERYVHRVGEAAIGTAYGEFRLIAYESEVDGGESHVALVKGDLEKGNEPVLVRMHAHCVMGDVSAPPDATAVRRWKGRCKRSRAKDAGR